MITDLAHLVDVPATVARRIDLLEEDRTLIETMRDLATSPAQRAELAGAGRAYWAAGHTIEMMAADYVRALEGAAARPAPMVADLPAHITADYSERARAIARELGTTVEFLE